MITAIVRYTLPPTISKEDCEAHFHMIAPGFRDVKGLLSKHFIWNVENSTAGGVYQWTSLDQAKAFYGGPWLEGIIDRYGQEPSIEYFEVFAITDNNAGSVELFEASPVDEA